MLTISYYKSQDLLIISYIKPKLKTNSKIKNNIKLLHQQKLNNKENLFQINICQHFQVFKTIKLLLNFMNQEFMIKSFLRDK